MKRAVVYSALLGFLLALSLTLAPAVSAKTYADKNHGFRIRVASGWTQTPLQPGEETEVAKFKDDRKGDFSTLSILRFTSGRAGATTPGEGDDEAAEEPQNLPPGYTPAPDSAFDYLKWYLDYQCRRRKSGFKGFGKPRTVKAGKLKAKIYTYELKHKTYRPFSHFWVAGILEKDGEEYLIVYSSPYGQRKKLMKVAPGSIKSFRFKGDDTPIEGEDVEKKGRATADAEDLIDPETRKRVKSELVGDWKFIDTPHYIVIYNCDRGLADYIAKRMEWMLENAFSQVFPPVEPLTTCMVVRVCKERDVFRHYSGMGGGVLGYWAAGKGELVFPDLSPSKRVDPMTIGVMNHEGFHQYIYYCLHKNNPPVWFNEGYAEYFYCVSPGGKSKMKFEKRHPMRFSTIKSAAGSGKIIPAKDFIRLSHRQYMQQANLCYAQGWAFATWLKRVTKNERYQQIPDIFFRELQKGFGEARGEQPEGIPEGFQAPGAGREVRQNALDAAFEGIDLDKLHSDFVRDLKKKM